MVVGVLAHGAGASAAAWADGYNPGGLYQTQIAHYLAHRGFLLIGGDMGGMYVYGNRTAVSRIKAYHAYGVANFNADPDRYFVVGTSGGALAGLTAARDAADGSLPASPHVLGVVGMIPGINLTLVRDTNAGGNKANIEINYGITSSDPLPSWADPYLAPNRALVASAGTKLLALVSNGDTTVPPVYAQNYVDALGSSLASLTTISETGTHSDTTLGAIMDPTKTYKNDITQWLHKLVA